MAEDNGSKVNRVKGITKPVPRSFGKIGDSYQKGKKDVQNLGEQFPVSEKPKEVFSR